MTLERKQMTEDELWWKEMSDKVKSDSVVCPDCRYGLAMGAEYIHKLEPHMFHQAGTGCVIKCQCSLCN